MRLHFTLSPNQQPVPFAYQHFLTGAFHKWLGHNPQHDDISLYSLSWLDGGFMKNGALEFPCGARWFISFHDDTLAGSIIDHTLADPEVCCGMHVARIAQQQTPEFGDNYTFKVGSPVLAKSKEIDGKVKHYIYSDPEADATLTATLRHKLDRAGFGGPHNQATVSFDKTYRYPKTKLVAIKDTRNRTSVCPVTVEGTREAVAFAWNVGVGNGTGSGFGSLL
ncbi:MAG: CRISPR-associated endoribonuclease Cas6 [Acidobacteria bacterium]|nr:MAG: CRISPR-associated endoribonuclease Cas6 [Acidobacteriota bacterium]